MRRRRRCLQAVEEQWPPALGFVPRYASQLEGDPHNGLCSRRNSKRAIKWTFASIASVRLQRESPAPLPPSTNVGGWGGGREKNQRERVCLEGEIYFRQCGGYTVMYVNVTAAMTSLRSEVGGTSKSRSPFFPPWQRNLLCLAQFFFHLMASKEIK